MDANAFVHACKFAMAAIMDLPRRSVLRVMVALTCTNGAREPALPVVNGLEAGKL